MAESLSESDIVEVIARYVGRSGRGPQLRRTGTDIARPPMPDCESSGAWRTAAHGRSPGPAGTTRPDGPLTKAICATIRSRRRSLRGAAVVAGVVVPALLVVALV
ncbi:hypothetical protein [Streptomyces sp. NPDC002785]|uniref:hypothetical protein n=1 Tax=Streptomyces sp. NPDC002785 TaxID=3154543 RepID=UPI00333195C6